MDYLERTLNLKLTCREWPNVDSLPYLLTARYRFEWGLFGKIEAILVYPKGEVEPISSIKKHLAIVRKAADLPAVLILDKCLARQRQAMIDNHIPFIVENKQIYLPFLGISLQESFSVETEIGQFLLPSAQLLLLYYIYSKKDELAMSVLPEELQLSAMSVSRAVRQLEEAGLIRTHKNGVGKIISSEYCGEELYEKSAGLLRSPVKKRGYLDNATTNGSLKAGASALAEYTMLNEPALNTVALGKLPLGTTHLENRLSDADKQQCVEIWNYDPHILSKGTSVDPISLNLSLANCGDERIQMESEKLMERFWGDYHGKGAR